MEKKNEKRAKGLQLTKDSGSEQMKAYFTKVFELRQTGEDFPINLDEVFPLIFNRKEEAVRALKSDFVENEDFILLRKNAEQNEGQPLRKNAERSFKETKGGGHNKIDYMLSVECMEYFVVKKVRPVFEVYRQVFHKTMESSKSLSGADKPVFVSTILYEFDTRVRTKMVNDAMHYKVRDISLLCKVPNTSNVMQKLPNLDNFIKITADFWDIAEWWCNKEGVRQFLRTTKNPNFLRLHDALFPSQLSLMMGGQ